MKESESQKKATRKYIEGMYRPSVYINRDKRPEIEKRFKELGYKSFNEYVIALMKNDGIDL